MTREQFIKTLNTAIVSNDIDVKEKRWKEGKDAYYKLIDWFDKRNYKGIKSRNYISYTVDSDIITMKEKKGKDD